MVDHDDVGAVVVAVGIGPPGPGGADRRPVPGRDVRRPVVVRAVRVDVRRGKPTRVGRKLNAKGKLQRYAKKTGELIK